MAMAAAEALGRPSLRLLVARCRGSTWLFVEVRATARCEVHDSYNEAWGEENSVSTRRQQLPGKKERAGESWVGERMGGRKVLVRSRRGECPRRSAGGEGKEHFNTCTLAQANGLAQPPRPANRLALALSCCLWRSWDGQTALACLGIGSLCPRCAGERRLVCTAIGHVFG
jgi:hypothetical protein